LVLSRRANQDRCWWCGADADSREHKLKKSDLVREFGRQFPEPLVRIREGREEPIQGPNSTLVKFKRTMCAQCNNSRSQPFDQTYDRFVEHLRDRERHILASRSIDLRSVYGPAWEQSRDDLLRYVVKHIGCRLSENEIEVPASFRDFLDGGVQPDDELALEIEIRTDIAEMARSGFGGGLGLGDVMFTDFDPDGTATVVESHMSYRWLRFVWGVGSELRGYPLPFDSPVLRLKVGRNLPPGDLRRTIEAD
jgi:hypothetical protein